MEKKLYIVYPIGYPEDYALVYEDTELRVIAQYCEYYEGNPHITLDEFYEKYELERISKICGKEIDKITFKR